MATLRLFANLKESAGTDRVEIEGATVGDVLTAANEQFGDQFLQGAVAAGVWLNGEPTETSAAVSDRDEIALIPPVSGGALPVSGFQAVPNVLSVALMAALLIVAWADPAWFTFVAVGAVLAWVWDLSDTAETAREAFVIHPPLIGATAAAIGAYAWGLEGFAGGMALGVIVAVAWPVFDSKHRDFRGTAATTLVTVIASGASAGLVLIRLTGSYAVVAFVLIAVFSLGGAWVAGAYGHAIQSVDANVGALLGALLAGLIAGVAIAELDVAAGLLGGVATAAGVIAGRTLGSMLRTGAISHTEDPPGLVTMFDGVAVAAPLFWIAIWLIG